jgi:hypothetical protein
MADKTAETTNPLDTWRQFITDSERQWNGFFKEVLGTDGFSSSMNTWVEASLTVQRMIADNMERYYTTFNIPTHNDLVALGERMKAIEETLARLESALAQTNPKLAAVIRPAARRKPARTKRPAVAAARSSNGSSA